MENQKEILNTRSKTLHFLNIHKKVSEGEYGFLNDRLRDIIGRDDGHQTYVLKSFNRFVLGKTEELYNDEAYYFNRWPNAQN